MSIRPLRPIVIGADVDIDIDVDVDTDMGIDINVNAVIYGCWTSF